MAEAGCFALVLEGVMEEIAVAATEAVACPTIGIGASARCDGQILVTEDMMGMFERTPRFVKRFGDLAGEIGAAAAAYAEDVKSRAFPTEEQIYRPQDVEPSVSRRPWLRNSAGRAPAVRRRAPATVFEG